MPPKHPLATAMEDAHQVIQLHAVDLDRRGGAEQARSRRGGDVEHELEQIVRITLLAARPGTAGSMGLVQDDASVAAVKRLVPCRSSP